MKTRTRFPQDPKLQRLYNTYRSILQTTRNPNDPVYRRQQAAGQDIGCHWQSFQEFTEYVLATIGLPGPNQRIVRRDQNADWQPGNIELGDYRSQGNRYRTCRFLEYQGQRQTLKQWSQTSGINMTTLQNRLDRGLTLERALTEAPDPRFRGAR